MRAFRPSRFAPMEEFEGDDQRAKDANLQVYAERAAAGVPLFETPHVMVESASHSGELVGRE